jgi:hypothetical protein
MNTVRVRSGILGWPTGSDYPHGTTTGPRRAAPLHLPQMESDVRPATLRAFFGSFRCVPAGAVAAQEPDRTITLGVGKRLTATSLRPDWSATRIFAISRSAISRR